MRKALTLLSALLFCAAGRAAAQSRTQDLRPKPPEYWNPGKYSLDATLSGSYLKGNVDNTSLAGGLSYTGHLDDKNQLSLDGAASYASFNGSVLLDTLKGSGLYAYAAAPHLNVFATTTHAKNRSIKLDYRSSNGAGVCVHGFMPGIFDPVLLSLALTPEHAEYTGGGSDNSLRGMLRLNFKARLNDYSSLGSDFIYTPDLARFSDHRFYGETYLQLKITPEKLFLRVAVSDEYDSSPRPGVKKNDFAVNYSLGLHLGK